MQLNFQAVHLDLYLNQSKTYSKDFTLLDNTPDYPQPIDIAGVTLSGIIKRYTGVQATLVIPTFVITSSLNGTFTMNIVNTDSNLLIFPRYVYEIIATDNVNASKIIKIAFGQLHVENF